MRIRDEEVVSGMGLLEHAHVATRLPTQDLDRARAFYSQKLGLEPVEEREGGLRYECASGVFVLFASGGSTTAKGTCSASANPCAERLVQLTGARRASHTTLPSVPTSTIEPAADLGNSATPPHDPRPLSMCTSPSRFEVEPARNSTS